MCARHTRLEACEISCRYASPRNLELRLVLDDGHAELHSPRVFLNSNMNV